MNFLLEAVPLWIVLFILNLSVSEVRLWAQPAPAALKVFNDVFEALE